MSAFKGFPEGKSRLTPLPAAFFTDLLPHLQHPGALKVTLFAFWLLDHQEGAFRYVRRSDFAQNPAFMQGLSELPGIAAGPEQALDESLEQAVQYGVLLAADLALGEGVERLYFLNSPRGRAAVQAIRSGSWRPAPDALRPVEFLPEPPNIFRLYEENIGPLTPLIAETLAETEATFPAAWIADALRIAVENNKRSWRYVTAILDRWQLEGRDESYDSKDRRDSQKDRRRYAEWDDTPESR